MHVADATTTRRGKEKVEAELHVVEKNVVLLPPFRGILTENRNAHYGQIDTEAFCHHAYKSPPLEPSDN